MKMPAPGRGAGPRRPRKKLGNASQNGGFGLHIRQIRLERGLTLDAVAAGMGMSASAVSKMEKGHLSLTYDKMTRLAAALGLSLQELLLEPDTETPSPARAVTGRRSITRFGAGRIVTNQFYDYAYYNSDLTNKRIVPMLGVVRARTLEEFGPLLRHPGEEFVLVLEGQVEVHTEFYEPEILNVGDGLYIDSEMGHAYLSRVDGGSRILAACTASVAELIGELRKRDRHGASNPRET